jgi:hypothetical protein
MITVLLVSGIAVYAVPTDEEMGAVSKPGTISQDDSTVDTEKVVVEPAYKGILEKAIKDKIHFITDQFLVEITRPESDEISTYKNPYVISGTTEQTDVRMFLEKYNDESEQYEAFSNTDEESTWDIGKFGVFANEMMLSKGANKIRTIAYRASKEDYLKLEDIQVNYFTITILKENIFKKVIDLIKENFLDGLFKKPS